MFCQLQNKRLLFNLSDPEYNYFEGTKYPPPPPNPASPPLQKKKKKKKKKIEEEEEEKLRAKDTKLVD